MPQYQHILYSFWVWAQTQQLTKTLCIRIYSIISVLPGYKQDKKKKQFLALPCPAKPHQADWNSIMLFFGEILLGVWHFFHRDHFLM